MGLDYDQADRLVATCDYCGFGGSAQLDGEEYSAYLARLGLERIEGSRIKTIQCISADDCIEREDAQELEKLLQEGKDET